MNKSEQINEKIEEEKKIMDYLALHINDLWDQKRGIEKKIEALEEVQDMARKSIQHYLNLANKHLLRDGVENEQIRSN